MTLQMVPKRCAPPWTLALLLAAVAVIAGGCAGPGLTMRVAGVSVGARSEAGVTLVFTVEARNQGDEEIELREARYQLSVNGARVFQGARSAEAAVAARGSTTIDLPVPAAWEALGVASADELASADLAHHFRASVECVPPDIFGAALFSTGLHRPRARVEERGALSFAAAQESAQAGRPDDPTEADP